MSSDSTSNITFYRYERTGRQIERVRKVKGRELREWVDEMKKVYYTERDVAGFSLENLGLSLPYRSGNKTIIDNYLLKYWQYFLGAEATITYINYLSLCINDHVSTMSLEHMAEMMGISTVTLNKYLTTLEEHGFVMRFWSQRRTRGGINDSTRVKVRSSIPFLSEKQISDLPDWLLDSHNRFMQKLFESHEVILLEDNDHTDELQKFMSKGISREIKKTEVTAPPAAQLEIKKERLLNNRSPEEVELWNDMLEIIKDYMNKLSFDTWFKNTFALLEDGQLIIIAPNDMASTWISDRYAAIIRNAYQQVTGLENGKVVFMTMQSYM